jgi:hypothetical protein
MSTNKTPFFFSSSQSVDTNLGNTFSFIWASYAGLRELWWQVRGFNANFPGLHISVIEKKFFSGLALPGGVDLNHICIKSDWTLHEEEFAKWLLFDACTLYEGWAEKVCSQVFSGTHADRAAKEIQFPADTTNLTPTGYLKAIHRANQNKSAFIKTEFFPSLSKGKHNKWAEIQEHLIGYRYFKECRNAFIHSDGNVTSELILAHTNFQDVLTQKPLLFKHHFSLSAPTLGDKIKLNVHDIILFTRLIKCLIATFDAALCVASSCEVILQDRLRTIATGKDKWRNLPSNQQRREQRIHRLLSASRIPEPVSIHAVDSWMVSRGIIHT